MYLSLRWCVCIYQGFQQAPCPTHLYKGVAMVHGHRKASSTGLHCQMHRERRLLLFSSEANNWNMPPDKISDDTFPVCDYSPEELSWWDNFLTCLSVLPFPNQEKNKVDGRNSQCSHLSKGRNFRASASQKLHTWYLFHHLLPVKSWTSCFPLLNSSCWIGED